MITHWGLRAVLGLHVIIIGLVILLIYHNRNRTNLGGRFFQMGREMQRGNLSERGSAVVFLVLGWMSILAGLIVLLVGFRPTMVG